MNQAPSDHNPIDFTGHLEKWRKQAEEFSSAWREWFKTQVQRSHCLRHGTETEADQDASIKASHVGKMAVVYHVCDGCQKDADIRRRSAKLREAGVTDENVLHATFENFVCRGDADGENLEAGREFASRARGFLIMQGGVGLGKTHLAVAIMRAMERPSRFITQGRLLRKLRETYRDPYAEDIVKACIRVRLLVLDEVGLSTGGRDELPTLHDILSARHDARKPTVLTSNLLDADFDAAIGERMADRLRQSGIAKLIFAGESLRKQFREEYHR